ncbi:MAG: hypothetical protein Q3971_09460 [Moraxella sp.]|nr:hypothetical protein [Moraxella sp.]
MNVSQVLALSQKLTYPDKSMLYAYFDAITFVDSVEAFLALTHQHLSQLTQTPQHQAFAKFLYQSVILPITQDIADKLKDAPAQSGISLSQKFSDRPSRSNQKGDFKPIISTQYIDFYDDFYHALYLNHWQDEPYLKENVFGDGGDMGHWLDLMN